MSQKPTQIFAIGGGELAELETLSIDKKIVAAARHSRNKTRVKALFLPTASGDDIEYYETFRKVYSDILGCRTDVLYLYGGVTSKTEIAKKINWCDLVYVGGGSTPSLMRMWRKYGLDQLLIRAWRRGVVMAGISAGANCWFSYGLSNAYQGRYIGVRCLGLVDLTCNVHYSSERGRKKWFDQLVARRKISGLALEDNACINITENTYEIIKSDPKAKAYIVYYEQGKIKRKVISGKGEICDIL